LARFETETRISSITGGICIEINRPCFFTQMDIEVKEWLFELQADNRLDVALKAFKAIDQQAIDQQMKIGADVREVTASVLREIRSDFSARASQSCTKENSLE
jgi:hypothetical protein